MDDDIIEEYILYVVVGILCTQCGVIQIKHNTSCCQLLLSLLLRMRCHLRALLHNQPWSTTSCRVHRQPTESAEQPPQKHYAYNNRNNLPYSCGALHSMFGALCTRARKKTRNV